MITVIAGITTHGVRQWAEAAIAVARIATVSNAPYQGFTGSIAVNFLTVSAGSRETRLASSQNSVLVRSVRALWRHARERVHRLATCRQACEVGIFFAHFQLRPRQSSECESDDRTYIRLANTVAAGEPAVTCRGTRNRVTADKLHGTCHTR